MRKVLIAAILGAGLFTSASANAQSWGIYIGNGGEYAPRYRQFDDDDRLARSICSGQRAHSLEDRLDHEEDEDEIDEDTARRIHSTIDRLEDRQRHECAEGDWPAIRDIAFRYDRIGQWINAEAHGGWQRGW